MSMDRSDPKMIARRLELARANLRQAQARLAYLLDKNNPHPYGPEYEEVRPNWISRAENEIQHYQRQIQTEQHAMEAFDL